MKIYKKLKTNEHTRETIKKLKHGVPKGAQPNQKHLSWTKITEAMHSYEAHMHPTKQPLKSKHNPYAHGKYQQSKSKHANRY